MKQLAPGVWQLSGLPPNAINVYLVEDVLIDAATRHAPRRILKQIAGRKVTAHALTHAHPDHQGARRRSATGSESRTGWAPPTSRSRRTSTGCGSARRRIRSTG